MLVSVHGKINIYTVFRSHCSYKDADLSCWNATLGFFEHVLLGHMRHYVAVQMNIDQWHRRHQKPHYSPDFEGMRNRSVSTLGKHISRVIRTTSNSRLSSERRHCKQRFLGDCRVSVDGSSRAKFGPSYQLGAALQVEKLSTFSTNFAAVHFLVNTATTFGVTCSSFPSSSIFACWPLCFHT